MESCTINKNVFSLNGHARTIMPNPFGLKGFLSGFAACCVVCAMIAKLLKATKANSTHFKIHLFFMFLV